MKELEGIGEGTIKNIKQKVNCINIEHDALDLQLVHDAAVLDLNALFFLHLISILVCPYSIYPSERSMAGSILPWLI